MQTYPSPLGVSTEYDSLRIMSQRFDADCLLFDLADGGRIIASRTPHARMRHGESFWNHTDQEEKRLLEDYLLSYEMKPVVVNTSLGISIIFPNLVPNTSLAISLIPHMEKHILLECLRQVSEPSLLWSQRLSPPIQSKKINPTETDTAHIHELLRLFASAYSASISSNLLKENLYQLSLLSGCPIHLISNEHFRFPSLWNLNLFQSMLTVALLLCRRISHGREAFLELEQSGEGETVVIRIPRPIEDATSSAEVAWLSDFSMRKRIFFECTILDNQLHLRLIPITPDWSYLGLKEPSHLGFMSHTPWSISEKS